MRNPGNATRRIEKYGLTECKWKDGSGVVVLVIQEFYGRDRSAALKTFETLGRIAAKRLD